MAQGWQINGVPMAIERDGWWLQDDPPAPDNSTAAPGKGPLAALIVLILLADILFYRQSLGLSLALFSAAVFVATLTRRPGGVTLVTWVLSVLPVVDYVQTLSVVILGLGLVASICLTRVGPGQAFAAVLAVLRQMPLRGSRDLVATFRHARIDLGPQGPFRRFLRGWAFPLGGSLVLISLLAEANPVLDDWLTGLARVPVDVVDWVFRALFWLGTGLMVWPLLVAPHQVPNAPALRGTFTWPDVGLNATSVANALIGFNWVLAVQTVLDARYLWSGVTPPGMTLAEYAHRGAYPLLATALLAGGFALAARPWVAERRGLRALLILWLAQNVALTLSALYRLDLYVGAFGLTYLRVYAGIWMALVAAGLALTLWQIAAGRSNPWLLIRCTLMGAGTLYLCAFVNFADIIARVNVAKGKIDPLYLCQLGPTAAAALPQVAWHVEHSLGYDSRTQYCTRSAPERQTWRNWGFRNWRVLRNLAAQQEGSHENPGRG